MANLLIANPASRPARKKTTRKTPVKRAVKRTVTRRRNPIAAKGIMADVMDAAIGTGGAISVDVVLAKFGQYIPADMQNAQMMPIVQGALSLGLGYAVSKFMKNRALGRKLATGGMTVAMYKLASPMVNEAIGGSLEGFQTGALQGFEYGQLGYNGVSQHYAA